MSPDSPDVGVFDSILDLEDQYYAEGYALGVADGTQSGKVEGRIFGMEKGFEKFLELGKLQGRASVWSARLPSKNVTNLEGGVPGQIKNLKGSERLEKHIVRLSSLTDPDEFTTENSEESVSEVDARLKDAHAKARLIARIVGEDFANTDLTKEASVSSAMSNNAVRVRPGGDVDPNRRGDREMEDFSGFPQSQT